MVLDGHVKAILAAAFSPNCCDWASDDTIRIWDMRAIKSLRFHERDRREDKDKRTEVDAEKEYRLAQEEWRYRSGLFFASSGYDGLVKLWSADDWQLQRTLSTDAGKVMSVDISSDGNMIASGTYNRNFQLFAPEETVTL
ncbi:hypothetical protein D9611_014629 [Ephemerocybe angulata]|uniref:Uncharacterized protein n=1 Tax=Ephemerocybe angulata TaxID=980116 RepID=A0A8H5BRR0_9AGAR|nr:hypothetical protein D9611_014629 [Tulosesus angulatus]